MKKNCPNCGAPFELSEYKCPYCGTLYLDLSVIDFDNNTPFFLTIKKDGYSITQQVQPKTANIEANREEVCATNGLNQKLFVITTNINYELNVEFKGIPFKGNHYCAIKKIEE